MPVQPFNVPGLNEFNLSYDRKFTFDMGYLNVLMCKPMLPRDVFKVTPQLFVRSMPMISPILQRTDCTLCAFFVPKRIVWRDYEDFYVYKGGNKSDSVLPILPRVPLNQCFERIESSQADPHPSHTLGAQLGLPSRQFDNDVNLNGIEVSALPFRGYNLIWNNYFRDQNLQEEIPVSKLSGVNVDDTDTFKLRRVAWRHDRFTSALPWPQRGDAVDIPISEQLYLNNPRLSTTSTASTQYLAADGVSQKLGLYDILPLAGFVGSVNRAGSSQVTLLDGAVPSSSSETLPTKQTTVGFDIQNAQGNNLTSFLDTRSAFARSVKLTDDVTLFGDVEYGAVSINALRQAFALQRYFEMSAVTGERYPERLLAEFGIKSDDARIQWPEYIGGTTFPLTISETFQSSETTSTSPQGNPSGNGFVAGNWHFNYRAHEEGFLYVLMYMRPRTSYMNGIPREFLKFDPFDFYKPLLAHLGEQQVWSNELFAESDNVVNGVQNGFGYQPCYEEYRHYQDEVVGDFTRDGMMQWHLARVFDTMPALNSSFIECKPSNRIFADSDEEEPGVYYRRWNHFIGQIFFKIKALRPVARFGVPY